MNRIVILIALAVATWLGAASFLPRNALTPVPESDAERTYGGDICRTSGGLKCPTPMGCCQATACSTPGTGETHNHSVTAGSWVDCCPGNADACSGVNTTYVLANDACNPI